MIPIFLVGLGIYLALGIYVATLLWAKWGSPWEAGLGRFEGLFALTTCVIAWPFAWKDAHSDY